MTKRQTRPIKQVDLWIGDDEAERVQSCIDNRWLTEGANCNSLAETVQEKLQIEHVTFAPNGTLGLFLALLCLDLPKGSEVLVPSFTFYGSVTPIIFAGLKPVFIDVCPKSFNSSLEHFKAGLSPDTSAIMPVHMFGQTGPIDQICNWAHKNNLKIIEDAAQAFGVKYKGASAGGFGDIGVISLFSDKVITAGEGALITTRSDKIYDRLRLIRNQGRYDSGSFEHVELGMNFRITDIQAGIALEQINKFDTILSKRLEKWKIIENAIKNIESLSLMERTDGCDFVPFRLPVICRNKNLIKTELEKSEIQTRDMFYPMHLQPKLRSYRQIKPMNAEYLHKSGICLPIHHHLSDRDMEYICHRLIVTAKH